MTSPESEAPGAHVSPQWAHWRQAIDLDEYERRSQTEMLVIPSPARREDPKNWVHKAVPLKPASKASSD